MLHKNAFGEQNVEIAAFQARFGKYRPDTFDKIPVAKLNGGKVDGNSLERQSRVLPGTRLTARFTQGPAPNGNDETAVFGNAHELGRRYESSIRMAPA